MDATIYIPTKGRQEPLLTLEKLEPTKIEPVLVHPSNECHKFSGQHLHIDCQYLGQVWQEILELCPTPICIIVDDDLRFATRLGGIAGMLFQSEPEEIEEMFAWMIQQAEFFAHGSISIRKGNHFIEDSYRDNANAKDCLYFRKDILLRENTRLDRLKTMQDFDITLQMFSKGYQNRVGFNWTVDQENPTAPGGTTLYRTAEVQKEAAYQLQELWPDYVKVVKKKALNKQDIYGAERYDVRISWRKCWDEKGRHHAKILKG